MAPHCTDHGLHSGAPSLPYTPPPFPPGQVFSAFGTPLDSRLRGDNGKGNPGLMQISTNPFSCTLHFHLCNFSTPAKLRCTQVGLVFACCCVMDAKHHAGAIGVARVSAPARACTAVALGARTHAQCARAGTRGYPGHGAPAKQRRALR